MEENQPSPFSDKVKGIFVFNLLLIIVFIHLFYVIPQGIFEFSRVELLSRDCVYPVFDKLSSKI